MKYIFVLKYKRHILLDSSDSATTCSKRSKLKKIHKESGITIFFLENFIEKNVVKEAMLRMQFNLLHFFCCSKI